MADDPNELNDVRKFSTKQVADKLNIDKSTLLRWIRQGKIQDVTHRDGRNWRVWLIEDVAAGKEYHDSIHNLTLNLAYEGKIESKEEKKEPKEEVAEKAVETGGPAEEQPAAPDAEGDGQKK
jgi:excisionase family DNA binding protein